MVTATLLWYYFICKREVWLMAHSVVPSQDNTNVEIGRYIHENSYKRNIKEVSFGNLKLDIIKNVDGDLVVGEIKKSSRFKQSARWQLLFYLSELKKAGIIAKGELLFPKEKKKESVALDDETELKLQQITDDIEKIIIEEKAAQPLWNKYCKNCAYNEFCWSEVE